MPGEENPLACACGMRGPKPYDEGRLSAAAAPVGAPPCCIETRGTRLRRHRLHRDKDVPPTRRLGVEEKGTAVPLLPVNTSS